MTFDPVSYSEIKKLGKPIVKSSAPPSSTDVIWYDETINGYRGFNEKTGKWDVISRFGVDWFDNNIAGTWINYIEIPVETPPTEDIEYLIEINGTTVNVYSNDLTTTLVSGTLSSFWDIVKQDGSDIRVFDETFGQNYFWIEEFDYTNQKCKIWVKLNAGQELIGIAFGNTYAETSNFNNIDQIFIFFDDFNGTSLDTTKWVDNTGGYTISDSKISFNSGDSNWKYIKSVSKFTNNIILEYDIYYYGDWGMGGTKFDGLKGNSLGGTLNYSLSGDNGPMIGFGEGISDWVETPAVGDGTNSTKINTGNQVAPQNVLTEHKATIIYGQQIAKLHKIYGNNTYNNSFTEYIPNEELPIVFGVRGDSYYKRTIYIDWVRVRKYISTDLTFGTPTLKSF